MSEAPRASTARGWGLVKLLRPKQWVKNVLIFAPLIFARQFTDANAVAASLLAFGLFCLAASACYILNDLQDVEWDRRHPTKRGARPIAAETVTPREASVLLAAVILTMAPGFAVNVNLMLVITAYVVMNVAYTVFLKNQPVVDIFVIAIGFVLRVLAGAVAIDVPLSGWMMITTLCLALYLAAVKRRQELVNNGPSGRDVLNKYSVSLVDRYADMAGTSALVFYSLYVMSTNQELTVTIPLVIFGMFRYWYVIDQQNAGESPADVLFSDWPLLIVVCAWVGLCIWTYLELQRKSVPRAEV